MQVLLPCQSLFYLIAWTIAPVLLSSTTGSTKQKIVILTAEAPLKPGVLETCARVFNRWVEIRAGYAFDDQAAVGRRLVSEPIEGSSIPMDPDASGPLVRGQTRGLTLCSVLPLPGVYSGNVRFAVRKTGVGVSATFVLGELFRRFNPGPADAGAGGAVS